MAPILKTLVSLLLLPLALGAPTIRSNKVRSLSDGKDIIPGKYIVVFTESANATVIAAHHVAARGIKKRSGDPVVVDAEYEIGDFKGYAVEADEESIEAIAATEEVRNPQTYPEWRVILKNITNIKRVM
jgi:hypothetical protein